MRRPNKEEVFEILILQHTDGMTFKEAIEYVYQREVEPEELKLASDVIHQMRNGWVRMNVRTRQIGR